MSTDSLTAPLTLTPSRPSQPFHIVAVGASAGGLEALEAFFKNVPRTSGMAYVVLQHLSPDFESRMDELLGRQTEIPIHRVHDGMEVEPDAIYLIPPKKEMIIAGGRLLLTDKDPGRGLTLPIDHFFRSLATDQGRHAIGVVLSGTGSDGSRGLRDIHQAGGLVVAQDVDTARFDGMPRSAIDTGLVDLVLPPHNIPATLLEHARRPAGAPILEAEEATRTGLDAIFALLRVEHGIDFAHYKPSTVSRRIERRLSPKHDIDEYARRLAEDPTELNALYQDLLIGVTRFLRDPEAFAHLEQEVIPHLLTSVPAGDEIRIWCAGCATGEEAYSLAMLVHEQLEAAGRPPNVKIFATDVHHASLETASLGAYSAEALTQVGQRRRERYFIRTQHGYTVAQDLRKLVVFARHNVLNDAPFTRLDLITCRNLLIYFQPQAQKKVLSLFHFGLKTGGTLFLGPSETPGELTDEFEALDKHWRLYRKRRDIRLPADLRMPLVPSRTFPAPRLPGMVRSTAEQNLASTYDRLLARFMPPALLVDEHYHLLHSFGGAESFIRLKGGRPSVHILDLLQDDLKTAVSGALQHAAKEHARVRYTGISGRNSVGEEKDFTLVVEPFYDKRADETHYLITLEAVERALPPEEIRREVDAGRLSRDYIKSIEDELRFTKENLQATIEELETSNEELQATNEELVASNEELQSTNEELHSVNEELYTVNSEHQRKIAELSELTDDMNNLLHSTQVGVVFLDPELCIRRFTNGVADVFRLLPQDVGRPFESFSRNVDYPDLLDDVRRVLTQEIPFAEQEVTGTGDAHWLLRILPYRHRQQCTVGGVVLTLIDIDSLKRAEHDVRRLSAILEQSADAIVGQDPSGTIEAWNRGAQRLYGYTREEALGRPVRIIVPDACAGELEDVLARVLRGEQVEPFETQRRCKDGSILVVSESLSPVYDPRGRLIGVSSIARDITKNKRAEAQVRQAVRQREDFLAMLSHELRNPLAAVLSASRVMQQPDMAPRLREKAGGVVERQAQHMARLLEDLLDISRMRQDKIEIRKELLDLRATVEGALETVRPSREAKRIRIEVQTGDEPLQMLADPARLRQLQVNLLTNAIKHSAEESRVSLSLAREGTFAVLRVEDEGEGIAPNQLETIFEPFTQLPSDRVRESGLGLGLALVRSIAEAHGGEAKAFSEGLGRGARLEVRLPLDVEEAQVDGSRHTHASGEEVRTVVLVEDEDDSRELLAGLLEHNGYHVVTARNGKAGVDAILRYQPAVALVDIGLPVQTGYQVAKAVRQELGPNAVYLVALTGYGQQADRDAVLEAGFDRHLIKPVQVDVLLDLLEGGAAN